MPANGPADTPTNLVDLSLFYNASLEGIQPWQFLPDDIQNLQTSAAELGGNGFAAAAQAGPIDVDEVAAPEAVPERPVKQQTVVKDEWSKTPRNAPCPCGSGKKFKMCHGATL